MGSAREWDCRPAPSQPLAGPSDARSDAQSRYMDAPDRTESPGLLAVPLARTRSREKDQTAAASLALREGFAAPDAEGAPAAERPETQDGEISSQSRPRSRWCPQLVRCMRFRVGCRR